ncbi:hypothetical protein [Arenibaculum sp.]|uniref:hypothetical protein n=1 Tax=Arenibaculum sp. TaxID=2865862 RepID=UPI002E16248F|nr:hypothetical protein [Arenibaculum sp.]
MLLATALMLAALQAAGAPPVSAGEPSPLPDEATRDILEGMERLRDGMSKLIDSLPRYAPPEITEDGDIIIRRLDPGQGGDDRREDVPRRAPPAEPGGVRI